jgi:preprotein translocase subunit SecG
MYNFVVVVCVVVVVVVVVVVGFSAFDVDLVTKTLGRTKAVVGERGTNAETMVVVVRVVDEAKNKKKTKSRVELRTSVLRRIMVFLLFLLLFLWMRKGCLSRREKKEKVAVATQPSKKCCGSRCVVGPLLATGVEVYFDTTTSFDTGRKLMLRSRHIFLS